jgi:hypothetical protein
MPTSTSKNYWNRNVTDDPTAPAYYSQQFIWWFSILFSVFGGSILLGLNLKDNGQRWLMIGFGIVYTALAIMILSYIPISGAAPTILVNGIGAGLLVYSFWNKYIGENTPYRKRPIWVPLIIALVTTIPIVTLIIMGAIVESNGHL